MVRIVGNEAPIERISAFMQTFEYKSSIAPSSCIIVSGNHGIGKTTIVDQLCTEHAYSVHAINESNCCTSKELLDLVQKAACCTRILSQFEDDASKTTKRKKIVVLDNLEVLIGFDRTISTTLCSMLKASKGPDIPIVCICDTVVEKKLGDLKKICEVVRMTPISSADLTALLTDTGKHINLSIVADIVAGSNGNAKNALSKLDNETSHGRGGPPATCMQLDKHLELNAMFQQTSLQHIFDVLNQDAILNALKFHENVLKELPKKRWTSKSQMQKWYLSFISRMTHWDAFITCDDNVFANDYLSRVIHQNFQTLPVKKACKADVLAECDIDFTKYLSQLSLQCKNHKMYTEKCLKDFPWEHLDEKIIIAIGK